MVIGLPPIMNYAAEPLRTRVMNEVLDGHKLVVLAITEAFAGSDVAGLKCTATRKPDGTGWIINGTKKWITGGTNADYFTVGCKTGSKLTVFLVERGAGVETKQIKTSYGATAGTAYVTFDNVEVPNEHMIGPENDGLRVILANFNHERWMIACQTVRYARKAVEECLLWGSQRIVSGKPLLAQPIIRAK
jgi:alkylation response protein AidB-like acyl-CoA dehydrogenase